MITINLIPEDAKDNIEFSKKNLKMLKYVYALIFLAILLISSFAVCYIFLSRANTFFLAQVSESKATIEGYNDVLNKSKNLEERIKSTEKIKSNYKYWTNLNYILRSLSPNGIYLTTLVFEDSASMSKASRTAATQEKEPQNMTITGYAENKKTIGLFRDALESTDEIVTADIQSISETPDPLGGTSARNVNLFVIKIVLEDKVFVSKVTR